MDEKVKITKVEDFIVYQKATNLFELFKNEDLPILLKDFAGKALASNQIRSLDSICANFEEGYERKAGKELINFFRISRGSAGESKGRFKRFKGILSDEVIEKRIKLLNEISAMLNSLITKLK